MILQILPDSELSRGFISFMEDHFPNEMIYYVLINESGGDSKSHDLDNVLCVNSRIALLSNRKCRALIRDSTAIVINWVDGSILSMLSPFLKKTALLFWGGDLIHHLKQFSEPANVIHKIKNKYLKHQIEHAPCVITLTEGEHFKLEKSLSLRGKWFLGSFMSNSMKDIGELKNAKKDTKPIKILVGNSATRTNRHVEALKALSRFKDEDIEIILPLSYGDSRYGEQVEQIGKELFGEKCKSLMSFMPAKDYNTLLSKITVGVFNSNRQQGMGNVSRLLALGAKVFLSSENPMYHEDISKGLYVFPAEGISGGSFSDFIYFSEEMKESNMKKSSFEASSKEAVDLWMAIFKYLNQIETA